MNRNSDETWLQLLYRVRYEWCTSLPMLALVITFPLLATGFDVVLETHLVSTDRHDRCRRSNDRAVMIGWQIPFRLSNSFLYEASMERNTFLIQENDQNITGLIRNQCNT